MEQAAGESDSSSFRTHDSFTDSKIRDTLCSLKLNDSQLNAVLDCLSASQEYQKDSTIKLIWGPPGTGKTSTISTMLWALLIKKRRTLSCAPTNTAITEITSRLLKLVREFSSDDWSLGDLVLIGNKNRMKIDDNLSGVFLDDRVDRLLKCFAPLTGWRSCLHSMMYLLENAVSKYEMYLERIEEEEEQRRKQKEEEEQRRKEKEKKKEEKKEEPLIKMTLKEFLSKEFFLLAMNLNISIKTLSEDLPKAFISDENFKNMNLLMELLNVIGSLLKSEDVTDQILDELFRTTVDEDINIFLFMEFLRIRDDMTKKIKLRRTRSFCIQVIRALSRNLHLPDIFSRHSIQEFCLQKAILIFCTSSSSFRLHHVEMEKPLEILVVDEAAQLKECECLIPLQLPRIQHAIFIGDEHQLPALVKSQVHIQTLVIFIF